MPAGRTLVNNVWTATPAPAVPAPTPAPTTPAPAVTAPWATRAAEEEWWRKRGGHELYDIFAKIEKENPLAARAFWSAVVGRGRGENDLMAATIHKKFGGDMNAYNTWRNQAHSGGWEAYEGNFDLANGKWTPGAGYNSQYIKDKTGWDVAGEWSANPAWNWANYKNSLQLGLQSTPGNEEKGAESWNTYGYGAQFGPNGVTYPSVYEQAVGSGLIQGSPTGAVGRPTAPATGPIGAPRTTPGITPITPPNQRVIRTPSDTTSPAPTPTAPPPAVPTPTNPGGAPPSRVYRYTPTPTSRR